MKASVIVPLFNGAARIQACIEALHHQSLAPHEIIVVDDGSTDEGPTLVKKMKGVKLVQQANQGPAAARNNGANLAKGDIVCFLDDDCQAHEHWLRELLTPFKDEHVVGVQGAYKTKQKQWVARFVQLEIEDRYDRMKQQPSIDWIGSYSAAYRKKVFQKVGGFDTSFPIASGEDPELSFRIAKGAHRLVFAPKAIVFHAHPHRLMDYLGVKFYRAFYRVNVYQKHMEKIVNDSYTPQTLKVQIGFAIAVLGTLPLVWMGLVSPALPLIFLLTHLLLSGPFVFKNAERDVTVAMVAPLLLFLRSLVFFAGLLAGTLSTLKKGVSK